MAMCQTMFGLRVPFFGSHPPESCHTICHTQFPFGRYGNSMTCGRSSCIPNTLLFGTQP